ncbi:tripartite tricarboxylate transporter TctB family protein [Pseudochelatococcus sp. B33]
MHVGNRDFLSGLLFCCLGAGFAAMAPAYAIGSPARIGAGFFPLVLGILLALIGLIIMLASLVRSAGGAEAGGVPSWSGVRSLGVLVGAVVLFGMMLNVFGLVASVIALVLAGGHASREFKLGESLRLAACLALSSALLFVVALKLPIALWPRFL